MQTSKRDSTEAFQSGDWMKDPKLSSIDHTKLDFLQLIIFESQKIKKEEMLPFFMSILKISKKKKISFSDEEMNLIVSVLENYVTKEELSTLHQIMNMRKNA